jgi:hypothetical protein
MSVTGAVLSVTRALRTAGRDADPPRVLVTQKAVQDMQRRIEELEARLQSGRDPSVADFGHGPRRAEHCVSGGKRAAASGATLAICETDVLDS